MNSRVARVSFQIVLLFTIVGCVYIYVYISNLKATTSIKWPILLCSMSVTLSVPLGLFSLFFRTPAHYFFFVRPIHFSLSFFLFLILSRILYERVCFFFSRLVTVFDFSMFRKSNSYKSVLYATFEASIALNIQRIYSITETTTV